MILKILVFWDNIWRTRNDVKLQCGMNFCCSHKIYISWSELLDGFVVLMLLSANLAIFVMLVPYMQALIQ